MRLAAAVVGGEKELICPTIVLFKIGTMIRVSQFVRNCQLRLRLRLRIRIRNDYENPF